MNDPLTLVVGSANPFELLFRAANDAVQSLAGASDYVVVIRESTVGTVLIKRTKTAGTVTVDVPNGKLVCTMTQPEADALVAGAYIGEAALLFGTTWIHTKSFVVNVLRGVATHS